MKRQTRLFPKAVVALEQLGENIKLARRRRGITSALMAERADMSLMTLRAIERGSPKVAMGNYMSVLFCLGMQGDIAQVAAADQQGRDIQEIVGLDPICGIALTAYANGVETVVNRSDKPFSYKGVTIAPGDWHRF